MLCASCIFLLPPACFLSTFALHEKTVHPRALVNENLSYTQPSSEQAVSVKFATSLGADSACKNKKGGNNSLGGDPAPPFFFSTWLCWGSTDWAWCF